MTVHVLRFAARTSLHDAPVYNNRLTCSTGIATLIDNAGNAVTSDADNAELLNQYFGSVCTIEMMASCLILNN